MCLSCVNNGTMIMSFNFLLKLFKLEYYFDKPSEDFQLPYSDLLGRTYSRLPVIRCFGSSPAGTLIIASYNNELL